MAVGAVIENGKIMESAAEKSVKSTASNKTEWTRMPFTASGSTDEVSGSLTAYL